MVHIQTENILRGIVIQIPQTLSGDVSLGGCVITFDKDTLSDSIANDLLSEAYAIDDFDIFTVPGDTIHIRHCQYTTNEYDGKIEIDVYNCITEGKTAVLQVKDIDGLRMIGETGKETAVTAQTIEIQLDRGSRSENSALHNRRIIMCPDNQQKEMKVSDREHLDTLIAASREARTGNRTAKGTRGDAPGDDSLPGCN